MLSEYISLEIQPPYGMLLSSSCGELKGPSGPQVIFLARQTDGGTKRGTDRGTDERTTGLREFDI